jgi:hypothetical protein
MHSSKYATSFAGGSGIGGSEGGLSMECFWEGAALVTAFAAASFPDGLDDYPAANGGNLRNRRCGLMEDKLQAEGKVQVTLGIKSMLSIMLGMPPAELLEVFDRGSFDKRTNGAASDINGDRSFEKKRAMYGFGPPLFISPKPAYASPTAVKLPARRFFAVALAARCAAGIQGPYDEPLTAAWINAIGTMPNNAKAAPQNAAMVAAASALALRLLQAALSMLKIRRGTSVGRWLHGPMAQPMVRLFSTEADEAKCKDGFKPHRPLHCRRESDKVVVIPL